MTAVEAQALEEARRLAMLSGDADALARLLAPELRYVHSTGVCDTRESLLQKVRERAITYLALSFEDMHATATEDAVLIGAHMRAEVQRLHEFRRIETTYLAVWLRRAGKWQLSAYQGTAVGAFCA
ncbi:nuclear transport factor 2 family protein [Variovorax beijingensis]|uniref:Nuclear transport factor 2 family protein n=1 Tax=Variovorax beijingensis TaxID=2496117 RepID=A0A3P3EFA8_9BURK|nr:nuclear transport factor 2 family protein [Variovorax beijingensis]RRH85033.1 nuclear transport factor 2 family protein [Variovorax beijingensis]